jgi:hypothetical protein
VGADGTACTAHRLRSPLKSPREVVGSACAAMGPRLKVTVAVAIGRRVLRRGSAVASAACLRHRVWLAKGASRLAAAARSGSCASRSIVVVSLCRPPCPAQGLRARSRGSMQSFAAPSMGLRITAPSRRHPTAGRTWHHVHSQPCAASHWMRLTSNVRFLQETHAQCELAVMRKAMHAAEEVQSPALRCCAAARSKVNWFVGADHSVGKGCRAYRGLSVLRRPAHGFFGHRPLRARSFSRGACALGVGCTSRASAACGSRVAASREAVAYCGMRRATFLQHSGLAEVVREVQA